MKWRVRMSVPDLGKINLLEDSTDLGTQVPDSPALTKVSDLVAKWDLVGGDIKKLEALISAKKVQKVQIEQDLLPTAMSEAGVSSFVTKTGRSVKIDEVINGSIPAPSTIDKLRGDERVAAEKRRHDAFAVVHEKWPGLIKTELSVSLGKGETELASRMVVLLRKEFDVTATVDETINHMSLNAHFKELKNDGRLEEIPVEPFQLYIGPIARIK